MKVHNYSGYDLRGKAVFLRDPKFEPPVLYFATYLSVVICSRDGYFRSVDDGVPLISARNVGYRGTDEDQRS